MGADRRRSEVPIGEHGVRTGLDPAVDESCEMHAEERELRIGYRVDEVSDQVLGRGFEAVILAAERHDADIFALARQPCDAVAVQAGAVDEEVGDEFRRRA